MTSDPTGRLTPVVRLAPAKLNLTLAVLGRREDGYHALHSVMAPLGLADRLSVAVALGDHDTLHVRPVVPVTDDLVLRAIRVTREAVRPSWPGAPGMPPPLAARLEKRIPIAAGLGGGSSDAAAAVDASLEAWQATIHADERLGITLALGSDVPFFLAGGIALVEGRGERVAALPAVSGEAPGVLLVTPAVAVSTAEVFAAHAAGARPDDGGAATRAASVHVAEELGRGMTASALLARAGILATANDLMVATERVAPGLTAFRRAVARLVRRPIGQSGSGPTLWALYPSRDEADEAAQAVRTAVAGGMLAAPGQAEPMIAATTLETGGPDR
jgi:4-diphosphocytidyl-2-C-methyl-D-erythritol kinase